MYLKQMCTLDYHDDDDVDDDDDDDDVCTYIFFCIFLNRLLLNCFIY